MSVILNPYLNATPATPSQLTLVPYQKVIQDQAYSYDLSQHFQNVTGYALAPGSPALQTGLSLSAGGTLSGTATAAQMDVYPVIRATNVASGQYIDVPVRVSVAQMPGVLPAPVMSQPDGTTIRVTKPAIPANVPPIAAVALRWGPTAPLTAANANFVGNCYASQDFYDLQGLPAGATRYAVLRGRIFWGDNSYLDGPWSTNVGSSTLPGSNVSPSVTTPVSVTPAVGQAGTAFSITVGAADGVPAPTFALTAATLDSGSGPVDVLSQVTGNAAAGYSYAPAVAGALSVTGTWTNSAGSATTTATATVTAAATVPPAMTAPTVTPLTTTSVRVTPGSDTGTGGATIDTRALEISTDGVNWSVIGDASSPIDVTGIASSAAGTTVYARDRAHNAVGWGAYSATGSGTTVGTGASVLTLTNFARDGATFDSGARYGLDYAVVPVFVTGTVQGSTVEARAYSTDDNGESSTKWVSIGQIGAGLTLAGSVTVLLGSSRYKLQIRDTANPSQIIETPNRFKVGHANSLWGQSEDARQMDTVYNNSPTEALITRKEQVERLALPGMSGQRSPYARKVAGVDALPVGASITGRIITLTGVGVLWRWTITDYEVQAADGADWLVADCYSEEVVNGRINGLYTALPGGRLRLRDVSCQGNSSFNGCGWGVKGEEPAASGKYGYIDLRRVRFAGLSSDAVKICAGRVSWCYGKWKKNLDGLAPLYNASTVYNAGDHASNANNNCFKSLTNNNVGNPVPSTKTSNANWQNMDQHVDCVTVTASVDPTAPVIVEYCHWDYSEFIPANGGVGGNNFLRVMANSNDSSPGPFYGVRMKGCITKRHSNLNTFPMQVGTEWAASPGIEIVGNWMTPRVSGSARTYIYGLFPSQSNVKWAGNTDYLTDQPISTPANATTGIFTPETNDGYVEHALHTRGGAGTVQYKVITTANPWTASATAWANVFMATLPGEHFAQAHHSVPGTSFLEALNDSTANPRWWGQDLALHNGMTMSGATKIGVVMSSWYAAPGSYKREYGEIHYQCMTGKRSSDGASIGAAAPYTINAGGGSTFSTSHLWSELYGDYSYTKWCLCSPHVFDPQSPMSDATFDTTPAQDDRLTFKEECRVSVASMVKSTAGQAVYTEMGLAQLSYWNLGSDYQHPNAASDDGLPRKARFNAYAVLQAMGKVHWKVPQFDQATWTAGYVDLKYSGGPVTTVRKVRGLPALTGQAHYTDVMGIQFNGFPASHTALIVDNAGAAAAAGNVRVAKVTGNNNPGDLVNYGEGGASGALILADRDGGIWMNRPIFDPGGLYKLEGIPIEPLPDQTLIGNTLASSPAPLVVAGSLRFRNPLAWPTAQRKWSAMVDLAINRTGVAKKVYQINNLHLTLEVMDTREPRVTLKDANSASLLSNITVPAQRVAWGARGTFFISVDLDAGMLWLSWGGRAPTALAFTPPSAGVGIASASRRAAFLATAANAAPGAENINGSVWSMDEVYDANAGAWPTGGTHPAGLPIIGPASVANLSAWHEGANAT